MSKGFFFCKWTISEPPFWRASYEKSPDLSLFLYPKRTIIELQSSKLYIFQSFSSYGKILILDAFYCRVIIWRGPQICDISTIHYIYTPLRPIFRENKGGINVIFSAEDYRNIMNGIKVEGFEARKLPFWKFPHATTFAFSSKMAKFGRFRVLKVQKSSFWKKSPYYYLWLSLVIVL